MYSIGELNVRENERMREELLPKSWSLMKMNE